MNQYERIDISEEIEFNKIGLSLKCMICALLVFQRYWI